MSGTIHHDTLLVAIFALGAWWLMGLFSKAERGNWFYVAGGLLAGVAALTKLSGLTLIAVIGLALCLKAVRDRDTSWLLRRGALILGVALAVAGWWYVRNQMLYGDPFGWRMFLAIHSHMVRSGGYSWRLFTHDFLAQVGRTFWGAFGYMHITFPEMSRFIWYAVALSIIGLALAVVRKQVDLKRHWAEWVVAASLLAVLFASFVRFSMATIGAGHARYFVPCRIHNRRCDRDRSSRLHSKTLSAHSFAGNCGRHVGVCNLVAGDACAAQVRATEMIAATELPERARAVNLALGQGVQLTGYLLESGRMVPGQSLPVTLYWQATGDPTTRQDPKAKLELVDENGNIPFSQVVWPVPRLVTESLACRETDGQSDRALCAAGLADGQNDADIDTHFAGAGHTGLGRQIVTELVYHRQCEPGGWDQHP